MILFEASTFGKGRARANCIGICKVTVAATAFSPSTQPLGNIVQSTNHVQVRNLPKDVPGHDTWRSAR
eukprot:3791495-Pyramimonas_sp.AAC.1